MGVIRGECGQTTSPRGAVVLPEEWRACLTDLAYRHGVHVLVESESGSVLAHATCAAEVPAPFVTAVLAGRACELTDALVDRRSVARLPGGPCLSALLPGWPGMVLSAPLTTAGRRVGWLWMITDQAGMTIEALSLAAREVSCAAPLSCRHESGNSVLAALTDRMPLPTSLLTDVVQVWVAAFRAADGHIPADVLRLAMLQVPTVDTLRTRIVDVDDTTYIVVLAPSCRQPAQLAETLQFRMHAVQQALNCALIAALSAPCQPTDRLGTSRAQADAALRIRPQPGRCTTLQQTRSALVVERFAEAAADLPDLGHDPVQALLDEDTRRGSDMARTLLTWLDTHGDVRAAADQLGIHTNTLRYRLNRLRDSTAADLDDPTARLEFHVRLRAHRSHNGPVAAH